jgi:hypothetical protein
MVDWSMEKRGGDLSPVRYCSGQVGRFRPCVTFERTGQQMDEAEVATLVENAGSDPPESRVHK